MDRFEMLLNAYLGDMPVTRWNALTHVHCPVGEIRRLIARYRAAANFRRIEWTTPPKAVADGYSMLVALTLANSAFEQFREKVFAVGPKDFKGRRAFYRTLDKSPLNRARAEIDRLFKPDELEGMLQGMVQRHLGEALMDRADTDRDLLIGQAIRHAFVHGRLSPSGDELDPDAIAEVCRELSSGMLTIVERHVSRLYSGQMRTRIENRGEQPP
jgi:hypothetical protein